MADAVTPPPPSVRLTVGITGHRVGNPAFADNEAAVSAALDRIFALLDAAIEALPSPWLPDNRAPVRLHSLLANGTDQIAAELALARGWDLVAPLPFGQALNRAINATPTAIADARRLIADEPPADARVADHAAAIRALGDRARLFELAECDDRIAALFLEKLAAPDDFAKSQLFAAEASVRVAQAGRILIEQSDIVIGVWDGATTAHVGGTGHTIATALTLGVPVVWIDPTRPDDWQVLRAPEALAVRRPSGDSSAADAVSALVGDALHPGDSDHPGAGSLTQERWRATSNRFAHAYRRVEALFGGASWAERLGSLRQHYAPPGDETTGDARDLEGRISGGVLRRFRWADGVSARLSDAYRGGMIVNFILSSLAIIGGIAYLPVVAPTGKWGFALFELALLCAILIITGAGRRGRWHGRWFETRRLAEYLRHAPILLTLGTARAPGRWPRGSDTSWPEYYARQVLRDVGLPQATVTPASLRTVLTGMLDAHVTSQRDYHAAKAGRLTAVHHNLDRASTLLFQTAVASVALYLLLRGAAALGFIDTAAVDHSAKLFTVLGVLFPTFGAGIAGIRYFGDFERFAAISDVTAQKLDSVHRRIALLAEAPDAEMHYSRVADLAHATDDVVFAEIENWQAVFGGKHMTVPV
jgi:hypothetical protein